MVLAFVWTSSESAADLPTDYWVASENYYKNLYKELSIHHEVHVLLMHSGTHEASTSRSGVEYHMFPPEETPIAPRHEHSQRMTAFLGELQPDIVTVYLMNRVQSEAVLRTALKGCAYVFHSNSGRTSGRFVDFLNTAQPPLQCIVCHDRWVGHQLRNNTHDKYPIAVMPSGVDMSQFVGNHGSQKEIECVWVGVNRGHGQDAGTNKNLAALTEVAEHCDAHFTIVGTGGGMRSFMQHVGARGLGERFRLLPWMHRLELVELLSRSKVFVLPSLNEASPRAVSEAMSCQLPVVGFDSCIGTSLQVNHWINGFRALDAEDFGQKIQLLVDNEDIRRQFGMRSRSICQSHFEEQQQIGKTCDLYERLASGRSIRGWSDID